MRSVSFTVIVATGGRTERLVSGMRAIARSAGGGDGLHRIVVVDNGPGHPVEEAIRGLADSLPVTVRCLKTEPRNKARALNAGIREADTDWLAFTDDDTCVDPGWLPRAGEYAQAGRFRVFGGRIVPGRPDRPLPRWIAPGRSGRTPSVGVFVGYEPRASSGELGPDAPAPFGANLFVRREVFAEYGLYDEALWDLCRTHWPLGVEDSEFGHRLKVCGEPIGYCHEARVVHPVNYDRCSLREHIRRAYGDGWRQPLVFLDERRPPFEPFRLRAVLRRGLGCVLDLWRGDLAGSADHLVEMVRSFSPIVGRLSPQYRAWHRLKSAPSP
jgi:GT2 family glycosyltransferase